MECITASHTASESSGCLSFHRYCGIGAFNDMEPPSCCWHWGCHRPHTASQRHTWLPGRWVSALPQDSKHAVLRVANLAAQQKQQIKMAAHLLVKKPGVFFCPDTPWCDMQQCSESGVLQQKGSAAQPSSCVGYRLRRDKSYSCPFAACIPLSLLIIVGPRPIIVNLFLVKLLQGTKL